jgi:hypothetical protein
MDYANSTYVKSCLIICNVASLTMLGSSVKTNKFAECGKASVVHMGGKCHPSIITIWTRYKVSPVMSFCFICIKCSTAIQIAKFRSACYSLYCLYINDHTPYVYPTLTIICYHSYGKLWISPLLVWYFIITNKYM